MLKKNVFTIGGFEYPHIGYTSGARWNGWATPCFEIDEALAVMKEFNADDPEFPMFYDKTTDSFCIDNTEDKIFEEWKGENIETEDGIKHLYDIGAYSWVWEDTTEYDIYTIAQKIEDFLYEYNTYEYKDNYDNRELVVEEIKNQLKEFKTLKQIIKILYAEELKEEELYNALREELKI
jgi:hypothetical protein